MGDKEPKPEEQPKKRMCCVCKETKAIRDKCFVEKGPDACDLEVLKHIECLKAEGFEM